MGNFSSLFRRPANFRAEIEAVVRVAGDERVLEWIDDHLLRLVNDFSGGCDDVDLENAFRHWKETGELSSAKETLVPHLRSGAKSMPIWQAALTFSHFKTPGRGQLAEGLQVVPVFCDEGGIHFAGEEFLAARSLTLDQVFDGLQPLTPRFTALSEKVFLVSEPSWLLLNLSKVEFPSITGEPVVIFLDGARAIVTGTENVDDPALSELLKASATELVLGLSYVVRSGALAPWIPPRSRPSARLAFLMVRRAGLATAYERQHEEMKSIDVFVPQYKLERREGLPLLSMASWTKGVRATLPAADVIILGRTLIDHRPVRFAQVLRHFGHYLLPLLDFWPPRWLTTGFPTDEELARLGEAPSDPLACPTFPDEPALEVPSAHTISKATFAKECLALLEERFGLRGEYDAEGFAVRFEIEAPGHLTLAPGTKAFSQLGLKKPYDRFAMLPDAERRTSMLDYLGKIAQSLGPTKTGEKASIMPLLQRASLEWHTPLQHAIQHPGMTIRMPEAATRAFAPGLRLSFVIDAPNTVQFLSRAQGQALAGSDDGLFELAMENLRRSTRAALREVRPGLFVSPLEDEYDATRVALASNFFGLKLSGRPVAFIPTRTTLIVTGSEDVANLIECEGLVREALKGEGRPVTKQPLRLTSDGWGPWVPPRSSQAHGKLMQLALEAAEDELVSAAELLQARWPEVGVAELAMREGELRPEVLVAIDEKGSVLVPKCDVVVLDGVQHDWASFNASHRANLSPLHETGGHWFRFERR